MADEQTPKIIVDDDWKSQARAEKERLAKEAPSKPKDGGAPDPNEPLGFIDLIRMLATQALMYLGAFPDPQTGKAMVALDVAKLHIDLLAVLDEKTKNNLTDEEKEIMEGTLQELRVNFVEISKAVAQAQQEGRLNPQGPGGPAVGGGGMSGMGGVGPIG